MLSSAFRVTHHRLVHPQFPLETSEGMVQLFSELSVFFPRQGVDNARDVYLVTMRAWFPGTWPTATAPRSTKAKRRAKRAAQSRSMATDPDDKGRVGPSPTRH